MDYRAIARTITDPENQPHQFTDVGLAQFFIWAADEIDSFEKVLLEIKQQSNEGHIRKLANEALRKKESE